MPVTSDKSHHSQPYLMPTLSGLNLPSRPLTSFQLFIHIMSGNPRTTNLNTIFLRLNILIHILCLKFALDKAINFITSSFVCFYLLLLIWVFDLYNSQLSTTFSVFYFIPDHHDQMLQILSQLHLARFN